jgi:hypothetical protein
MNEIKSTDQLSRSTTNTDGHRTMAAAGGIMVGVSLLVGLQFPFLFPKSAPYMATPGPKIRRALKFLNKASTKGSVVGPKGRMRGEEPPVFVDLGSGDGQAVYEAARLGYRAVGIEFNWTLWAVSSIRRQLFWTPQEKLLSSFLCQDYHSYNLQNADTVMIFAIPRTMPVLGTKIQRECKPGTDILAYRFGIPLSGENEGLLTVNRTNDPIIDQYRNGRLYADLIYNEEDMRIYRTKDKLTAT